MQITCPLQPLPHHGRRQSKLNRRSAEHLRELLPPLLINIPFPRKSSVRVVRTICHDEARSVSPNHMTGGERERREENVVSAWRELLTVLDLMDGRTECTRRDYLTA